MLSPACGPVVGSAWPDGALIVRKFGQQGSGPWPFVFVQIWVPSFGSIRVKVEFGGSPPVMFQVAAGGKWRFTCWIVFERPSVNTTTTFTGSSLGVPPVLAWFSWRANSSPPFRNVYPP